MGGTHLPPLHCRKYPPVIGYLVWFRYMNKKLAEQNHWRTQAKCLDSDPQAYELNTFRGDRQYYAAGVCMGCKVIRECALDALEPLAIGTVRGGVWIGEHTQERASARRRLSVVALGRKP